MYYRISPCVPSQCQDLRIPVYAEHWVADSKCTPPPPGEVYRRSRSDAAEPSSLKCNKFRTPDSQTIEGRDPCGGFHMSQSCVKQTRAQKPNIVDNQGWMRSLSLSGSQHHSLMPWAHKISSSGLAAFPLLKCYGMVSSGWQRGDTSRGDCQCPDAL